MSEQQKLGNEGDQELRLSCIDIATRVVGKPEYFMMGNEENEKIEKHQDDVVEVATKLYEFVKFG